MFAKAKVPKKNYVDILRTQTLKIVDFFRSRRNGLFCGEPCRSVAFETRSFCYRFSHLARSSLKSKFLTSQACSIAGTLLAAITTFVLFIFSAACSQFSYCAQPSTMNDGSSFPIKIERLLGDRVASRDCGDGIFIAVARGNLLLSDAVLL